MLTRIRIQRRIGIFHLEHTDIDPEVARRSESQPEQIYFRAVLDVQDTLSVDSPSELPLTAATRTDLASSTRRVQANDSTHSPNGTETDGSDVDALHNYFQKPLGPCIGKCSRYSGPPNVEAEGAAKGPAFKAAVEC